MLPRIGIARVLSGFDEDAFYIYKPETSASGARPPLCSLDSALSATYVELEQKSIHGLARPFKPKGARSFLKNCVNRLRRKIFARDTQNLVASIAATKDFASGGRANLSRGTAYLQN